MNERAEAAARPDEGAAANVDQQAQARLALLAASSDVLLASLELSDVFEAVGSLAATLLPADAHAVWHYQTTTATWRVVWQHGLSAGFVADVAEWSAASGGALRFTSPLPISDVDAAPTLEHRRAAYAAEGLRSLFIVPLRIGRDHCGTIVAYHRARTVFSEADIRVATAFGNIASSVVTAADLYQAQSRSRAAAELSEHRAQFLARAAAALADSLDYEQTLQTVARLAVPEIADWCAVDIVREAGTLERVAVAHVDPDKVLLARRLTERYPPDPGAPYGVHAVQRTAQPMMLSRVPDEMLAASARDPAHLQLLRDLGIASYMSVPLLSRGGVIGVLTFVSSDGRREYGDADLRFAQEVASRAALAVENSRAYAEARRANQLKDDFLATLSHELRTPLNAISGYTHMLLVGAITEDRRLNALRVVDRNAAALRQIVEDVLDVSRIVTGKMRIDRTPLDLRVVIEDAVASVAPAADAKGVRLVVALGDDPARLEADGYRLQQVIWNLLSNAIKFTPAEGQVVVRLDSAESHFDIVVQDSGAGIAPAFLPHIFEQFRQADSRFTREHSGLGLGLAIAKRMVELHDGVLSAASLGVGAGATFRVRLPRPHPTAREEQPAG